jgi:S-adenosylmethionine/arginine decarboxylase-like enzyme
MNTNYWGYHLILDCTACDKAKVTDGQNIINFTKELIKRIDMVPVGEPLVKRFALHDNTKAGYSMLQWIETSHLSGHFIDSNGDAYFDIFSCKPFSNAIVTSTVREYFSPENINTTYLTRDARVKSAEVEQFFDPLDPAQR